MILLFDMKNKKGYYSNTFAGLTSVTGKSPKTLYRWLEEPDKSLKQGFMIVEGIRKTSNQGGKRPKYQ